LPKPHSNRIAILQKRIRWLEGHRHYRSHDDVVKELKQELADLLAEDAKADKLRSLPLFV
jgi:hypothetical protein